MPTQAIPMGIEHSTPIPKSSMAPLGYNASGAPLGFAPTLAPGVFTPPLAQGQQAFGVRSMGISHTTPAVDPYWQLRAQVPVAYPQYAVPQMITY